VLATQRQRLFCASQKVVSDIFASTGFNPCTSGDNGITIA
jgi:hypothetical protein